MHLLKTLIIGPPIFISTLIELRPFLKFNLFDNFLSNENSNINFDVLIHHEDSLNDKQSRSFIDKNNSLKILASSKSDKIFNCDVILRLPTTVKELNSTVENLLAKKIFNKNSSIKIKDFFLNKNEKKLSKDKNSVILTEKEIQLLELLKKINQPVSKEKILSSVWRYSSDADTHTVETHIYRLRKKINENFSDENFILNNKDGYYL